MTANTAPASKLHPCACAAFSAAPGNLTEEQVEGGNYETWAIPCQALTAKTFAPGHDAKLKGFLIKHEVAGNEISKTEGGLMFSSDAVTFAAKFGFAHMVAAGIAKAQAPKAPRKARKAPVAKTAKVQAKIGRWVKEGVVNAAGQFEYVDAKGAAQVANLFQLV